MCGIAGVLGAVRPVEPMIEAIRHRGPDGIRVEQTAGGAVGHARLSIIDLEYGWQPLHAAGSTVIGNGEIYNYVELTEEFGLGSELKTGSDFEPLLHLYAREGEQAFDRLRGMYAFCLVGCDGRTWLVRDPFGIKPLHIRQEGDHVAFASEPRALRPGRIRPGAASELLGLNYALAEMRAHVRKLEPGEVSEVRGGFAAHPPLAASPARRSEPTDGRARARRVLPIAPRPAALPAGDPIEALDAVLEDSVRVHQRSDVPYGLFLSGGIDSTTIATMMARLNARPVTAFTCGFEAPGARDERAAAERVARALDLDWRETTFTEADFWRILPEVAWALDDPTTDYATLPTWKLAEAAKDTLTVVLSGEGGDELFAGYGRYRRALRPRLLGGRPAEPRVDARFLKQAEWPLVQWRQAVRSRSSDGRRRRPSRAPGPGPLGPLTPLQQAQWADIVTWLPNDLLLKLDRCLMAHGLEGRTPFLDREVAAFAFHLPDRLKLQGRYGKWILRKWLERHCPAAQPWAKKQGFTVPVAAWIAPRAADLAPRIAAHEGIAEVCEVESVRAVFTDERQAHNRWPLLFYAIWWNIHVGGMERQAALNALLR